jgi:hypothetical protein
MALEIQVLAWDRHKNGGGDKLLKEGITYIQDITGLYMRSKPFPFYSSRII